MSTRATYRVKEYNGITQRIEYFYIHYDGYPEGAAQKFKQLLLNMDSLKEKSHIENGQDIFVWRPGKSIIAFGMLPYAEFTEDHEEHGDTEYQYDLYYDRKNKSWDVVARGRNGIFFDDTLLSFIKKYSDQKEV